MEIRKAKLEELDRIMEIYDSAKRFMAANGNRQWSDGYPFRELIWQDMDNMYVCMEQGETACVFYFAVEEEEDYKVIDGDWLNEEKYGVVHRLASAGITKGAAKYCLDWAFSQIPNIRIDTYRDNIPMQNLLKKCGFQYCGKFERIDMEWMAFQKTKKGAAKR